MNFPFLQIFFLLFPPGPFRRTVRMRYVSACRFKVRLFFGLFLVTIYKRENQNQSRQNGSQILYGDHIPAEGPRMLRSATLPRVKSIL